jgi:hypothetical protein
MEKGSWFYREIEEIELGKRVAEHTAFEVGCYLPEQLSSWIDILLSLERTKILS